jgi:hypothetical protein
MSYKLMDAVQKRSWSEGNDRHVLIAIASFANPKTGKCYPAKQKIALRANCYVRSVKRSIQRLKEMGELKIIGGGNQVGYHKANSYEICLPEVGPPLKTDEKKGDQMSSLKGDQNVGRGTKSVRKGDQMSPLKVLKGKLKRKSSSKGSSKSSGSSSLPGNDDDANACAGKNGEEEVPNEKGNPTDDTGNAPLEADHGSNGVAPKEKELVKLLLERGITPEGVAVKLARENPGVIGAYCRWYDWQRKTRKVPYRTAGLRRAIEQRWLLPDHILTDEQIAEREVQRLADIAEQQQREADRAAADKEFAINEAVLAKLTPDESVALDEFLGITARTWPLKAFAARHDWAREQRGILPAGTMAQRMREKEELQKKGKEAFANMKTMPSEMTETFYVDGKHKHMLDGV